MSAVWERADEEASGIFAGGDWRADDHRRVAGGVANGLPRKAVSDCCERVRTANDGDRAKGNASCGDSDSAARAGGKPGNHDLPGARTRGGEPARICAGSAWARTDTGALFSRPRGRMRGGAGGALDGRGDCITDGGEGAGGGSDCDFASSDERGARRVAGSADFREQTCNGAECAGGERRRGTASAASQCPEFGRSTSGEFEI